MGINRGPDNKLVAQLLTSYFYDDSSLGPATAKREVGALFDEPIYNRLKENHPDLVYQLFLLNLVVQHCVSDLGKSKSYVSAIAGQMRLTLFSLIVKSLNAAKIEWRSPEFTAYLHFQATAPSKQWRDLIAILSSKIREQFYAEAKRYKASSDAELAVSNFFKSHSIIQRLLASPLSAQAKSTAKLIAAEL